MESSDSSLEDIYNSSSDSLLWANNLSTEAGDISDADGSGPEHGFFYCLGRGKTVSLYDMLAVEKFEPKQSLDTEDSDVVCPKKKRKLELADEMHAVLSSSSLTDEDCDQFTVGFGDELFEELGMLRGNDEGASVCFAGSDSVETANFDQGRIPVGAMSDDISRVFVQCGGVHVRMKRMELVLQKVDPTCTSPETKIHCGPESLSHEVKEAEIMLKTEEEKRNEQCISSPCDPNEDSRDDLKTTDALPSCDSFPCAQQWQEKAVEEEEEEEEGKEEGKEKGEEEGEKGNDDERQLTNEEKEDALEEEQEEEKLENETERAVEQHLTEERECVEDERVALEEVDEDALAKVSVESF